MLRIFVVAMALALPSVTFAEEQNFTVSGGQVSVPAGLTVQVKSVTVGDDATTVHILASFDSRKTSFVNMTDDDNAYLTWGEEQKDRLFMRLLDDNPFMRITNGQTMEGTLVFPGTLPTGAEKVLLVFNPGRTGEDTNGPGITIPLDLKP